MSETQAAQHSKARNQSGNQTRGGARKGAGRPPGAGKKSPLGEELAIGEELRKLHPKVLKRLGQLLEGEDAGLALKAAEIVMDRTAPRLAALKVTEDPGNRVPSVEEGNRKFAERMAFFARYAQVEGVADGSVAPPEPRPASGPPGAGAARGRTRPSRARKSDHDADDGRDG